MSTITELKWQAMTQAVNEMKSPNQFIKRRFYSNHEPKSVENIELSVVTKGRDIAPFVRKNGEAIMVAGHGETFYTVEAPNISIKKPETPSNLMFQRKPGTVIFASRDTQITEGQRQVARNLQVMNDYITNAEEWMCAQALVGTISYSVTDQEVFTITFPKPAACNITLTTFWDDADPTLPNVEGDFTTAKRVASDQVGLSITDAVMGQLAAQNFLRCLKASKLNLTTGLITAGQITLEQQFSEDGVLYMGRFAGVECWEYSRQANLNGVATDMIRSKYVEFIAGSPSAQRVLYYGGIPDIDAFESGIFVAERFAKSWKSPDPSVLWQLVKSRPLPVPRRPGAGVSMKVVSG